MEGRTIDAHLLAQLAALPPLLEAVGAALIPDTLRVGGPDGAYSFTEHVWHLADLEREGYGVRITRLLSELDPVLPDFDGDRIAREREYASADPDLGVRLFAAARARNVERLRSIPPATLARTGAQEHVGRVALADVPAMMARHDQMHAGEIADLLERLAGGAPHALIAALRAHASAELPQSPEAPSSRPAAA